VSEEGGVLTADGVVGAAVRETDTRVRFQAWDLEVEAGAGAQRTAACYGCKSQEATGDGREPHGGG